MHGVTVRVRPRVTLTDAKRGSVVTRERATASKGHSFEEITLHHLMAAALRVAIGALLVIGCATPAPSQSVLGAPTSPTIPASSPTPTETETPSTTTSDGVLIAAAREYATRARIQLNPTAEPLVDDEAPSFVAVTLRAVSLVRSDSTLENQRTLRIYFDGSDEIRVVESGSAFAVGSISRAEAIAQASEQLRLAGHDPADGTIEVASGQSGQEWYVTFSRVIDGYPVSNYPLAWGPDGDKAYVNLRATGVLEELYYVRRAAVPHDALHPTAEMDAALSAAMRAGGQGPQTPAPGLTVERGLMWIQPNTPSFDSLVLSYCESAHYASGWSTTCIDPSTGRIDLREGAVD